MVRYVSENYGAAYTAQVNTFGTIKAKAAVKDSSRILGCPFAMGDKITKAMPPDVMGKGVPLKDLFEPRTRATTRAPSSAHRAGKCVPEV